MKRRKFVKKGFLAAGVIGLATGLYAWQVEPFWLDFEYVDMPLRNLPPHLDGKMLMQISDIHVGNRFDYQFIINSFKRAQQLSPDIVVYTGDYVSYESDQQLGQLREVMQSAVKGRFGTLAILGNHDYGRRWSMPEVADDIVDILSQSEMKVLRNDSVSVEGINFIGLDDYWGPNFDPKMGLKKYDSNLANIVLCHNPDVCDLPIWADFKGWILSGHTHGGQVKPPFLKPPRLPVKNKKYTSGYFPLGWDRHLYINRALGHLRQVRFNVRPEITVFKFFKV